jgi:hypothetical protein
MDRNVYSENAPVFVSISFEFSMDSVTQVHIFLAQLTCDSCSKHHGDGEQVPVVEEREVVPAHGQDPPADLKEGQRDKDANLGWKQFLWNLIFNNYDIAVFTNLLCCTMSLSDRGAFLSKFLSAFSCSSVSF